ncbi:ATP-binding protein [Paraburkholderia translucens]|uniref:ATP-binding protein n=1 Tax=Paraburkholderia translucens TaxID=2886945 RepID=UPI001E53EC5A|nr:ATP-binding protein [Paraburkholderia sp. MMS20-SJTN17]
MQPHVFDLFAQSARGQARAEGGLVIGLAVAKRMIELHGGTISLHSNGAATGTVVTLRLPILRKTPAHSLAEQVPITSPAPVRLLLVEQSGRTALARPVTGTRRTHCDHCGQWS